MIYLSFCVRFTFFSFKIQYGYTGSRLIVDPESKNNEKRSKDGCIKKPVNENGMRELHAEIRLARDK
jgi:hypothetical protein